MRRYQRRTLSILLLWLISAASARADTTLKFSSQIGVEKFEQVIYISEQRLRMDIEEAGIQSSILYDGKNQQLTILDHSQEVYVKIDRPRLEQQRQTLATTKQQRLNRLMQHHLEKIPAEEREAWQENFSKMLEDPAPRIEKNEDQFVINRIECVMVDIYDRDQLLQQWCVADWHLLDLSETDYHLFKELMTLLEGIEDNAIRASAVFDQIDGLPIYTVQYKEDIQWYVSELKEIDHDSLGWGTFRIPWLYKEIELPE